MEEAWLTIWVEKKVHPKATKRKMPQTLHVITATAMKMVWDEL